MNFRKLSSEIFLIMLSFALVLSLSSLNFSWGANTDNPNFNLGAIAVQINLENFGNPYNAMLLNGTVVKLEPVPPTPGIPQQVTTDFKGRADFYNLPAGIYKLTVYHTGYRPQIIQLKLGPGERKFVTVTLEAISKGNPLVGKFTIGDRYNPAEDRVYVAYARRSKTPPGVPEYQDVPEKAAILHGWNPMKEEWEMERYLRTARVDQRLLLQAINGLAILSMVNDGRVKAAVPLSGYKPYILAFHPYGKKLYVLDMSGNLLILNVDDDNRIVNRYSLGGNAMPTSIKVTNSFAYITAMTPDPEVIKVDTVKDIPVKSVKLPPLSSGVMGQVYGVEVSYDGSKLFVTYGTTTEGELLIMDASSLRIISRVKVGPTPMGVASPDGRRVYVANYNGGSVSVVDAWNSVEVGRIHTGINPVKVKVHPSLRYVYVCNRGSDYVTLIDVFTNRMLANIQVGKGPVDLDFSPDGKRLYVVNSDSGNVSIIDTSVNAVIANSPENPFSTPYSVAVRPR